MPAPPSDAASGGAEEAKGTGKGKAKPQQAWAPWATAAFLLLDLLAQPIAPPSPAADTKEKEAEAAASAMAVDGKEDDGDKKLPAPTTAAAAVTGEASGPAGNASQLPQAQEARPLLTEGLLSMSLSALLPVLKQAGGAAPHGPLAQAALQLLARCVAVCGRRRRTGPRPYTHPISSHLILPPPPQPTAS